MLNRRHLRVKVLQILYAYFQSEERNVSKAEEELMMAIEKMYDLYIYLLLTFEEVRSQATARIDDGKKKLRPSDQDLHPNMKFVSNVVFKKIEESKELRSVSEKRKVNWLGAEQQEMFRKMFIAVKESETYIAYMNESIQDFEMDRTFLVDLFKTEIANFPLLYHFFEEKSIYWMDDIDLACSMVLKTLKSIQENEEIEILPLYKADDDEQAFVRSLLKETLNRNVSNELLIDELTKNWEFDRIAKMDVLLMKMAITELQVFSNIPTKVTLNEYIEISKYYSTPKSNGFINGILDKAIIELKKENKIVKTGRGLLN